MVVLTKYYEMDDDGSKSKRSLFRRMFWSPSPHTRSPSAQSLVSPPRERRPLRSVPSSGPEFKVDPDVLVKEFVEKEAKLMGTIVDTSADFNTSNRSLMLSLIDEKRRVGQLPWQLSYKNDVILSFSVYNIKISCRDGEQLVHRIPTHKISATGYIQDDRETLMFIKFASELATEMCNIVFFNCDNKTSAQELCCLTHQLFQLVYTESTMDFFDKSIQDGAVTPKHHSYSTDDSDKKTNTIKVNSLTQGSAQANDSAHFHRALIHSESPVNETLTFGEYSKISNPSSAPSSIHRHHQHYGNGSNGVSSPMSSASTPSSPASSRRRKRRSESSSGSYSQSSSHQLQRKEYIDVLEERLTAEELRQFATELHHFRNRGLTIETYCDRLMLIYKEHRKSLLLGMRHFIPDPSDRTYFEKFLLQHDVTSIQNEEKRWWDQPPAHSRTASETEESSAHSAAVHSEHLADVSSNSEHASTSPTSHTGSHDWESVMSVQQMQLSDSEADSSTLKPNQVEQPSTSEQPEQSQQQLEHQQKEEQQQKQQEQQHQPDEQGRLATPTSSTIPVLIIGSEGGDSPLLRSGDDAFKHHEAPLPAPQRRSATLERQKVFKKKSRGKSPSAVELGAPFPSIDVTSPEDDAPVDDVSDTKAKKESKKKTKDKSSSLEKDYKKKRKPKKLDLKKSKHEVPTTPVDTPQTPDTELLSPGEGVTSQQPTSQEKAQPQQKSEHRKKKRHKQQGEVGVITHL